MRRIWAGLIALLLILGICGQCPRAAADNIDTDITDELTVTGRGYDSFRFLTDGDMAAFRTSRDNAVITLESETPIAGIYLIFDREYAAFTITDNETGDSATVDKNGVLHTYVDMQEYLGATPTSLTLEFTGQVRLSEISAFSVGELPEFVQRWAEPLDVGADLVLFSAHGDDEQLYFAGLLPYYAGELGYRVQVVYLTDHRNMTSVRVHEMLNSLWSVGVRAYPVFGSFADFRVDSLDGTYQRYEQTYGTTKEDLLEFVVTQIRRFKPLVAVGHDLEGEYGHGMHRVYADLLTQAVTAANDPEEFQTSAQQYGVHEIQKLYLHLYEENPIVLDYDQPLDAFDGLTAFQVTQQLGFPCHESQQQWPMFVNWLYGHNKEITKASQITQYSPCEFGLYYSAVGEDVEKNDFFENLRTYDQQEQDWAEAERLEQERLEQERLEQERLEQERLEQEQKEKEEQKIDDQIQKLKDAEAKEKRMLLWGVGIVLAVVLLLIVALFFYRRYRIRIEHAAEE